MRSAAEGAPLPKEPTADDAISLYRQIMNAGEFSSESTASPKADREAAMQDFKNLMSLLTPDQRQQVWNETVNLTANGKEQ